MTKKRSRLDLKAEFREVAKTDQHAADILLVDDQDFDPGRFLLFSMLITALRSFQRFEALGVKFGRIAPELIIDFTKRGDAALFEHGARLHGTKSVLQAGGPDFSRPAA